jgi:hypothetical protein
MILPTDVIDNQKKIPKTQTGTMMGSRVSVRRPEDVKFRMPDEEQASKNL